MVAFNFKSRFAPKISAGTKFSTIRSKKRCKVGDAVQLYTGQGTPACKLIREDICVGTARIHFDKNGVWHCTDISGVIEISIAWAECLYLIEGFKSPIKFIDFFRDQYGLPYSGFIHQWAGNRVF